MSFLIVENIFKDFSGLEVLFDVNLGIERGEKHAIIGPNGAGKSTLFNIITGKYRPSRGRVILEGEDISNLPPHKVVYKGIARSFQILNLFPSMSVFENIRNAIVSKIKLRFQMGSLLRSNRKVTEETEKILELMELTDRRNVPVLMLSYGEQRQIEIALTLALDPKLIMMDEPTAGLNKKETQKMIDLIRRVTQDKTVILVEHDMSVVFGLADRISVLYYGKVLATGSQEEIRNSKEVKDAYLGKKDHAA